MMRVVIYDEEGFEPITVVDLPGLTERDIADRRHWRVPVPEPLAPYALDEQPQMMPMRIVELTFEPFSRSTPRYGRQDRWICFTRATELAMLLTPDWLPGQRSAVQQLQRENDRLIDFLTHLSFR